MVKQSPTVQPGWSRSYLHLSNLIDDCCVGALEPVAFALLRLILNRTVRIAREENSITYDEIRDGVFIDGACVQRGLGLSPATISKHVKTLIDLKLVRVRFDRSFKNGFMYSIYSIDHEQLRSFAMGALPIPKRLRNQDESLHTVAKLKTPRQTKNPSTSSSEVTARTTTTTVGSKVQTVGRLTSSGRSAHCRVSRSRKTYETAEQALQAVQQRAQKAAGLLLNDKGELKQQAFAQYWVRAVREHYPGAVVAGFTLKEFCMFRSTVKSIFATVSPGDFVHYIVTEWKNLLKEFVVTNSKWRASDVPDIQSVVKHWRTIRPLLVAYFSEEAIRARNNAGSKERAIVKSYEETVAANAQLVKQLEVERDKIRKLEADRAEVYELASRRGISLTEERREKERRAAKTRRAVDLQADDDLPEWK